jgi:1-acyl-sn-glycerol-3-phosphate acyltransferase
VEFALRVCDFKLVLRSLRAWACSLLFLVVFGLTMVLFDVVLRVASLFGKRPQSYVAGVLQVWLLFMLRICGGRIDVDRSPLVRPHTSYLIVSNHQSMFDMPIFGSLFFSNFPKYISKVELSKWIPSVSFHLRHGGHAIIDRKQRDAAIRAIEKLAHEVVENGFSAVIFPEGTRAKHGNLASFKPAGTLALLEQAPHTPIVPVCIDNSWRIMEHKMLPVPFGLRLRCWIGDPIARKAGEDPHAILADIERQIHAAMDRLRRLPARAA